MVIINKKILNKFKIFITLLFLIFILKSLSKAEDVHEFEIHGLTVGESLLNFKSKQKIEEKEKNYLPSSTGEKFYRIAFKIKDKNYDFVGIYLKKNDLNYSIYSVEGMKYIKYSKCKTKMNEIYNAMKVGFGEKYIPNKFEDFHSYDKSKKSKVKVIDFMRSDDYTIARIICTDWGKKLEAEGLDDNLAIYLQSEEFSKYMLNEAYK